MADPAGAFPTLADPVPETGRFILTYVLPLAGAASIAALLGMVAVGFPMPGGWVRFELFWAGLLRGLLLLTSLTGGILLTGSVTAAVAPFFGGRGSTPAAVAAVGYAATPLLFSFLLAIFPPLIPLVPLGGLYGIRILAFAAPPFLGVPRERARLFAIVTGGVAFAIGALGWLLYRVLASGGGELGAVL